MAAGRALPTPREARPPSSVHQATCQRAEVVQIAVSRRTRAGSGKRRTFAGMLKSTIRDGPQQLRTQQKIAEARAVDADIRTFGLVLLLYVRRSHVRGFRAVRCSCANVCLRRRLLVRLVVDEILSRPCQLPDAQSQQDLSSRRESRTSSCAADMSVCRDRWCRFRCGGRPHL